MINAIKKFLNTYRDKKYFMIGNSHFLNMCQKYNNVKYLSEVDYKVFSQNGEDGIIDYLLYSLKLEKPKFLEIGIGDYSESNTRFIFQRTSTDGHVIDCVPNLEEKIKKKVNLWKGNLNIINKKISSENITEILNENLILQSLYLFRLDIDGIDYWIIEKLPKDFSKIAILEYNHVFGIDFEVRVVNNSNPFLVINIFSS